MSKISVEHQEVINSITGAKRLTELTISGLLSQHVLRMYGWNKAYVDVIDDEDDEDDDYFAEPHKSNSLFRNQDAYNKICAAILSNPGEVEPVDVEQPLFDEQYIFDFAAELGSKLVQTAGDNYSGQMHSFIQSSLDYVKNYMIYEAQHEDSLFNPWEPIYQMIVRGYLFGADADGMHCMHLKQGLLF